MNDQSLRNAQLRQEFRAEIMRGYQAALCNSDVPGWTLGDEVAKVADNLLAAHPAEPAPPLVDVQAGAEVIRRWRGEPHADQVHILDVQEAREVINAALGTSNETPVSVGSSPSRSNGLDDLARMWWKPEDDEGPGCLIIETVGGPKVYRREWHFGTAAQFTEWGWVLPDTAIPVALTSTHALVTVEAVVDGLLDELARIAEAGNDKAMVRWLKAPTLRGAALEAAAPLLGPRPLLDEKAVATAIADSTGHLSVAITSVMELARPMPTQEQIEQTVADAAAATGLARYFKSGSLTDPSDLDEFTHAFEVLLNGAES